MRLTTHTDYALRLLIYLASCAPERASTKEVALAYGISLHHLTKVAKSLTKAGWLIAAKGSGGGLSLASHTPGTPVGEIVRFTESDFDLAECFDPPTNTCPIIAVCRLKPVLYRARKAFFDVLDTITVAEMAKNSHELRQRLAENAKGRG